MTAWRSANWVPLLATVEWREEGRGRGRPVALLVAGTRTSLAVLDAWVEGPVTAGEPVVRVFVLEDESARVVRVRDDGRGAPRVDLLVEAP